MNPKHQSQQMQQTNQSQQLQQTNQAGLSWDLLSPYGWNREMELRWRQDFAVESRERGLLPARMIADMGHKYRLITPVGELWGELSGKYRFKLNEGADGLTPAVGDWVAADCRPSDGNATIHGVMSRKSQISRQAAGGETKEQIVASNVDVLFLVAALNHDFNERRLERYLIMAYSSGAMPVIVLSKADLCSDLPVYIARAEGAAPGVPVLAVSALEDQGIEQLAPYLAGGKTCALTGSSGSGKSTLLNRLAGLEVQATGGVRESDSRGRHTTTHRELFPLPGGGVLIDTPGMRELQLWDGGIDGLSSAFSDIEELAEHCKFRDCRHLREEGCAVQDAVSSGMLDHSRVVNFHKTQRELEYQATKEKKQQAVRARGGNKKKSRSVTDWTKED